MIDNEAVEIVQVAFQVPSYVALGLKNGAYELCGGVVREVDTKRVVKWLREADIVDAQDVKNAGKAVVEVAKNNMVVDKLKVAADAVQGNKPLAIGVGVAIGVAAVAGTVYHFVVKSRKKEQTVEISKNLVALDEAIGAYNAAVNSGEMKIELIDNLIDALERADENAEIKISVKEFKKFVESVREYTKALCAANNVSSKGLSADTRKKDMSSLIYCLEFQKKVFERAA